MDQSGGQMVEQTTHIMDMARYLAGDIVQVQAFETRQVMHHKVENCNVADAAVANLVFENGAVGTISNTCMLEGRGGESSLRVMADAFTLNVAGGDLTSERARRQRRVSGGRRSGYDGRGQGVHQGHRDGRPQRGSFGLRGCL